MGFTRCKCGKIYNAREKVCPECHEPYQMPFKKLWGIVGAAVIVAWIIMLATK